MKKAMFIIAAVVLSVTGLQAQKKAQAAQNWQKIVSATVDFKATKNAATLSATDNFKSLQIKTGDSPVHIDNLVVVYESGDNENIPVRFDFKPNAESRPINLANNKSKIKEIDIIYKPVPNFKGSNATIEIWGTK